MFPFDPHETKYNPTHLEQGEANSPTKKKRKFNTTTTAQVPENRAWFKGLHD
jgi:hypothetical protein